MSPVLEVDVTHRLGDLTLEARFCSEGPVTVLFGHSGSGKTSLLNLIAGLTKPREGRITFAGEVLADAGSRQFQPAHQRRFGYVFQDARLFPHLSVRQNLMYGRWFAGPEAGAGEFDQVVDLLGLDALLRRWPSSLSGGEKQRVAIGRALLAKPRLLLMDEPLASLDDERKDEILSYIEKIRTSTGVPIVYVSHSVPEVIRLASHLAILDRGRVKAFGTLAALLARIGPDNAGSLGEPSVLVDGVVAGFDPAFGLVHLDTGLGRIDVARAGLSLGQQVRIRILASDVMLAGRRPEAISAQNILAARVVEMHPVPDGSGARLDVRLAAANASLIARITAKAAQQLDLAAGNPVFAVVKSVAIEH